MASLFVNGNSLHAPDDHSQPASQASSPASPSATFMIQQGHPLPAFALSAAGYDGSQPGTPTSLHTNASLDPPPGVPFTDYLRTWSDAHVAAWLTSIKCPHHASLFRQNDIRGDVLLELDQATLKEMGMITVGDRIRIVAAVKSLRQKATLSAITNRPRVPEHARNGSHGSDHSNHSSPISSRAGNNRRLDGSRPAPLHLTPGVGTDRLPSLIRDGQDSARANPPPMRPLPQPSSATHTPSGRAGLPPLPPPPRTQPPPPPGNGRSAQRNLMPPPNPVSGRRTPTLPDAPAFNTSQPLPPAPNGNHLSPSSNHDGRPLPPTRPIRSPSPLQNSQLPSRNLNRSPNEHGRAPSLSATGKPTRPSNGNSSHPYATTAPPQSALSPIAESFMSGRNATGTPSPPVNAAGSYRAPGSSGGRPGTPSSHAPSLDDIKKKVIKFTMPEESKSSMVAVSDCSGGAAILERALRKLKAYEDQHTSQIEIVDGGLTVDGWGAFSDYNYDGSQREYLPTTLYLPVWLINGHH